MTIAGAQVKAARELLGWPQGELSTRSRVGILVIAEFEEDARELSEGAIIHLRWALQSAGVEFTNEADRGVKIKAAGGIDPAEAQRQMTSDMRLG